MIGGIQFLMFINSFRYGYLKTDSIKAAKNEYQPSIVQDLFQYLN